MNRLGIPLLALLVACGGGDKDASTPSTTAPPAPSQPAPPSQPSGTAAAPAAAPAETVGPEGPADIAVPEIASISTDAAVAAEGEKIWNARGCGGCHQFGAKLVGPDLVGVTGRRPLVWIERMVLHPDEMLKRDPTAKDLFKTHMTPMPKQGVTDEELPKLLAYIKSKGG